MPEESAVIEVKNFSISYRKRAVLKNISFSLRKNECLTIVGESGAGKTTLLRALIGLIRPDSGDIFIESESIINKTEKELLPFRKKIAFAFQNGALFDSMTVFENIAFPLRERARLKKREIARRVREELKEFGLEDAGRLYPSELSGGMKKRAGIARAVVLRPKVILYDEPTANLDPYSAANLINTMLYLKKRGTASVLVTHDMPVALKVSDRIALLMDGGIQAEGTPETLQKSRNILIKNFVEGVRPKPSSAPSNKAASRPA